MVLVTVTGPPIGLTVIVGCVTVVHRCDSHTVEYGSDSGKCDSHSGECDSNSGECDNDSGKYD